MQGIRNSFNIVLQCSEFTVAASVFLFKGIWSNNASPNKSALGNNLGKAQWMTFPGWFNLSTLILPVDEAIQTYIALITEKNVIQT